MISSPNPLNTNQDLWLQAQAWANTLHKKTGVLNIMRALPIVACIILSGVFISPIASSTEETTGSPTTLVVEASESPGKLKRLGSWLGAKGSASSHWIKGKMSPDERVARLRARLQIADELIIKLQAEQLKRDTEGYELWVEALEGSSKIRQFLQLNRPNMTGESLGVSDAEL